MSKPGTGRVIFVYREYNYKNVNSFEITLFETKRNTEV